ncbi:MAG: DUF1232 domain-containing protein [Patescibacteria group bacterium]
MRSLRFTPDWRAVVAYLRDPTSDWKPKMLATFVIAYLLWPVDLIPDVAPVLGWFDDIGLAALAAWYLVHASGRKRPPPTP